MNNEAVERDRDRELRAQIDPLIGQLSFTGKWELVMRLALESVRQGFTTPGNTIDGHARAELPAGEFDTKRDGGGVRNARDEAPAATHDDTR